MVIFAAGKNKKLLTFHSFKNAGGMLLCPENKLMCLLGAGASAIAIKINSKQLVANCNLVTPTIDELCECKTADKVSAIKAPNETGLMTYPGSASFLAAPWLVNTVTAANSSNPFHLIAVVNAAAKTFNKEHYADAEYITKGTNNAGDFIFWAWGVGAGRVTKTSFSIDPKDTNLELFKTQHHQIHNSMDSCPKRLTPISPRRSSKPCCARTFEHHNLLTSGSTRRRKQFLEKQVNHLIKKENSSKNHVKNFVHSQNDPLCLRHGQRRSINQFH
jgi:hypothetical protein